MNESHRLRKDFGRAAVGYEAEAGVQRDVANWLLAAWTNTSGPVADLGSGPGMLAELAPETGWLQVDIAEPMGRVASRRAPFICADVVQLPFPDGAFEQIASNLCLQWLPIEAALTEWRRVAVPGGRLLATLPIEGSLFELQDAYRRIGEAPRLLAFAGYERIKAAAAGSGWHVTALDLADFTPRETPRGLLRQIASIGGRYKGPLPPLGPAAMRRLLAAYAEKDGMAMMTYRVARLSAVAR